MNYFIPLLVTLFIGSTKEVFKKKILAKIEPIQFIVIFYGAMFVFSQFTISEVTAPDLGGWILLVTSSIFYVLANLIGLRVLKQLRISVIKPMDGFESVIVLLISFLVLKEMLNIVQMIGVAIIIIPLLYLMVKQYKKHSLNKIQIGMIFSSLLFAAMTTIFDRLALRTIDPVSYFYFLKLVLFVMFVFVLLAGDKNKIDLVSVKDNIIPISFLAIFTMIGTYAYFFALSDPVANTGIIKTVLSTSLIFSAFFGGKYFQEKNLKEAIIVSSFVIIGINILVFF